MRRGPRCADPWRVRRVHGAGRRSRRCGRRAARHARTARRRDLVRRAAHASRLSARAPAQLAAPSWSGTNSTSPACCRLPMSRSPTFAMLPARRSPSAARAAAPSPARSSTSSTWRPHEPRSAIAPPHFDAAFRTALRDLILWRRDVRRFKTDPVDPALVLSLIELRLALAVGRLQPAVALRAGREPRAARGHSRLVRARQRRGAEPLRRRAPRPLCQAEIGGTRVRRRCSSPCLPTKTTSAGAGLGSNTMPETLRYSVVGAIQTLWLAARAHGLGVGWVSILEPGTVAAALDVPATGGSSPICASAGRPRSTSTPSLSATAGRSASIRRRLFCGGDHSAGAGSPAASRRGLRIESRG